MSCSHPFVIVCLLEWDHSINHTYIRDMSIFSNRPIAHYLLQHSIWLLCSWYNNMQFIWAEASIFCLYFVSTNLNKCQMLLLDQQYTLLQIHWIYKLLVHCWFDEKILLTCCCLSAGWSTGIFVQSHRIYSTTVSCSTKPKTFIQHTCAYIFL